MPACKRATPSTEHCIEIRGADAVVAVVDKGSLGKQTILATAEAEGKGVILASMGTLCNFGTEEFRQIAKALSSLNYTVVWKVAAGDLPGNATVESLGIGANVKVRLVTDGNSLTHSNASSAHCAVVLFGKCSRQAMNQYSSETFHIV